MTVSAWWLGWLYAPCLGHWRWWLREPRQAGAIVHRALPACRKTPEQRDFEGSVCVTDGLRAFFVRENCIPCIPLQRTPARGTRLPPVPAAAVLCLSICGWQQVEVEILAGSSDLEYYFRPI